MNAKVPLTIYFDSYAVVGLRVKSHLEKALTEKSGVIPRDPYEPNQRGGGGDRFYEEVLSHIFKIFAEKQSTCFTFSFFKVR